MHSLAKSVMNYARKHGLLRAGDRVGVAVSGGADSVGLLRILLELRPELGLVLCVVHVNHKLRGAESEGDGRFVRKLAKTHGLDFVLECIDVKAHAAEKKLSLEAAARELRYEFFRRLLRDGDLNKIASAHTLDDQAETVLLKLARGAGTRGLAGIYPEVNTQQSTPGTQPGKAIVRPLLSVRRADIEAYLSHIRQSWREDSSNREMRHTRNRIRRKILPQFEKLVNPGVREAMAEAAEIARAEEEFWAEHIGMLFAEVSKRTTEGVAMGGARFEEFGLAAKRRLVRAAGESVGLNLEFRHVEEILALKEGGRAALPHEWLAVRHRGDIQFEEPAQPPTEYEYELPVPGKISVSEAELIIEAIVVTGQTTGERCPPEHLLDGQTARWGLVVRNWRAGDRFWPAHSKAPKKIKELLQDRHITGNRKRCWPVVASGGEVVWLRGFGVREDFQSRNGEGILIRELPRPTLKT